ncbi:MAG: hypothetical protein HY754_05425, partial [Nitrospirae bacterium]|nr:hypothetical protein [Nitrospirota bacterium]
MKRITLLVSISLLFFLSNAYADTFTSGSTGADGAFSPTTSTVVQLPADGIFNYTTVNIPSGITVKFQKNTANMPIYILATGDVTIAGTIDINGENGTAGNTGNIAPVPGGKGGPGGYDGGYGGEPGSTGISAAEPGYGLGPGGGVPGSRNLYNTGYYMAYRYAYGGGGGFGTDGSGGSYTGAVGGKSYGNSSLTPLIGGSGGGGGYLGSVWNQYGGGGGGGGGAILLASSGTINVTGEITS